VAPNPARNRAAAPDPTDHQRPNGEDRRQTVGATPTLPPNPQPAPTSHQRQGRRPGVDVDHDHLVLGVDADRPPTTHAVPAADQEREGDLALEEAAARLHRELAETEPATRTPEEPEPLGRRLPAQLDAARQGVER
jgi:hypothetical protein